MSNAVKFTYEKGRVTLDSFLENGNWVVVVEDNGMGIPQADQDRIFRIGENVGREGTAKEKSTGLGLILCKEFVEKCGGRIWVESKPNAGSRFFFSLPVNPNVSPLN
jgi:signal transduction histidine kinase